MQTLGIETLELVGGETSIDFINTVHKYNDPHETDEITDYGLLLDWLLKGENIDKKQYDIFKRKIQQSPEQAASALTEITKIRRAIFVIFSAYTYGNTPDLPAMNIISAAWKSALKGAHFMPSISGGCWQFDISPDNLISIIYPLIANAMDLLQSRDIGKIRLCEADNCTWLFMDRTKNHSRRWCQMGICGNRAKAKRHYNKSKAMA